MNRFFTGNRSLEKFRRSLGDVVDKLYKPEYKWVMRKKNRYERIPGSGKFISKVIKDTEEQTKYQLPAMEMQKSTKEELKTHCQNEKVAVTMLQSGSLRPHLPKLNRAIALN